MPRTAISIPITNIDSANAALQGYFSSKFYKTIDKDGEILMEYSPMTGFVAPWYIAVKPEPAAIVIECFLGKPHKKEMELKGTYGFVVKDQARAALAEMQQVIAASQYYNPYPAGPMAPAPDAAQAAYDPQNPAAAGSPIPAYAPQTIRVDEKKGKWAFVSIAIGAIGLIGALTNAFVLGWLIGIIGIMLAVNALKTSKRGFAIAGIVLNCILIAIWALSLVSLFL